MYCANFVSHRVSNTAFPPHKRRKMMTVFIMVHQLKEAYEQMLSQPTASGSQGMSDESGTDNDSKVIRDRPIE